ncbi:MAG: nicotinamide riboside transporter PnuC [Flavobacteriales bacterium]|jgi:nicotinamide mononucleotide transporter
MEALAVALNLLYTWLYLQSDPRCYLFGAAGPALFVVLCAGRQLYAEVLLQVVYTGLAIYGWMNLGAAWEEKHWSPQAHLALLGSGTAGWLLMGWFLSRSTDARMPYTDSFTTTFGICGTWAMVNYVHANWLYFIAINTVSVYLYARRGMKLGAGMYVIYLILALGGYFRLKGFVP